MKNAARRQRRSPRRAVLIRFVRDVADQPADDDVVAGTANRRYSVSGGKGDHQVARTERMKSRQFQSGLKRRLHPRRHPAFCGIGWASLRQIIFIIAIHLYNCDSGGVRIGIFTLGDHIVDRQTWISHACWPQAPPAPRRIGAKADTKGTSD